MIGVLTGGLLILALISGILERGVAFAAVPFLSYFLRHLVYKVHPLSLLLNGTTPLFVIVGFAQSGLMGAPKAIGLAVVTTLAAPLGSWLVRFEPQFDV